VQVLRPHRARSFIHVKGYSSADILERRVEARQRVNSRAPGASKRCQRFAQARDCAAVLRLTRSTRAALNSLRVFRFGGAD